MIREDRFVQSHRPYAVDLGSLAVRDGNYCTLNAAWFRRRKGVTVACLGCLWDVQRSTPESAADFLAMHDDGRYGGDCRSRWDGQRFWSAVQDPNVQAADLALLKPMLAAYPQIPDGFSGRWPTNVVLVHAPGCEQVGTRVVRNQSGSVTGDEPSALVDAVYADRKRVPYQARETETVAVWDCEPNCPVAEMDRQSGVTSSSGGAGARSGKVGRSTYGDYDGSTVGRNAGGLGDSGGASRYFPIFKYEAKAPAAERPRLADGTAHTTVKPLELMRWLVRPVTPPGGTVLDPFAGSGTTLEAAILEGFRAIGIEREPQYADLCVARLSKPLQPTLFGDAA